MMPVARLADCRGFLRWARLPDALSSQTKPLLKIWLVRLGGQCGQ